MKTEAELEAEFQADSEHLEALEDYLRDASNNFDEALDCLSDMVGEEQRAEAILTLRRFSVNLPKIPRT